MPPAAPPSSEPKKRPRLGVAVVVTDDRKRILLGRRGKEPNRGLWVIPGGGVELGETMVQTAHREIQEETGLRILGVRACRPLWVQEVIGDDEHRVIVFVEATVVAYPRERLPKAGSDLLEARFFERGSLPHDISPVVVPVLRVLGWLP